jgi:hypothetical protein
MIEHRMSDADARYLAAIVDDCRRILGDGVEIDELIWDDDSRLTLRYRLDGWTGETVVSASTVVEAHGELRTRLVVDRLRLGFTAIVEPRPAAGGSASR